MHKTFQPFLVALLILCGCVRTAGLPDDAAGQSAMPDRAYAHWLEKQAMYNNVRDLLGQVSQTERMWLHNPSENRAAILLKAAPTWLAADLEKANARSPLFAGLLSGMAQLAESGLYGIYLGNARETGGLWETAPPEHPLPGVVSFDFDSRAGDEKTFDRLMHAAENLGIEIGSSLPAAFTGIGPDFILQTRNAPGSQGLYAMLEIPQENWALLEKAESALQNRKAAPELASRLAKDNLVPARLASEDLPWLEPGGWAYTGETTGVDGKRRRWLYRYFSSPHYPLLMWDDPFGQARRVLAAAIIQQTGLQGQALSGLSMTPLFGLVPGGEGRQDRAYAPGLAALNDLASQIHRYGGWALQADSVPEDIMPMILAGGCDFCRDDISALLACASLLQNSAAPLAAIYSRWLSQGLDSRRLARGLESIGGIPVSLALQIPGLQKHLAGFSRQAHVNPEDILAAAGLDKNEARRFLISFRAGLPGLVFYGEDDLAAGEAGGAQAEASAFNLKEVLRMRKQAGLASARLAEIYRTGDGCLGLLSKLENGGYWLLAMNFAKTGRSLAGTLPDSARFGLIPGEEVNGKKIALENRKFQLALNGRECVNILFSAK